MHSNDEYSYYFESKNLLLKDQIATISAAPKYNRPTCLLSIYIYTLNIVFWRLPNTNYRNGAQLTQISSRDISAALQCYHCSVTITTLIHSDVILLNPVVSDMKG